MLETLVADFSALPEMEPLSTHDARSEPVPGCSSIAIGANDNTLNILSDLLEKADFFLAVAPEDNGILEAVCGLRSETGARSLNSSLSAVRLCASKYASSRHLRQAGIAAVPSCRFADFAAPANSHALYAIKPDKSAGAEGLRRARAKDIADLSDDEVIQPWMEGQAGSLSLVCRNGQAQLLAINRQFMRCGDSGWYLQSCLINGFSPFLIEKFSSLAQDIARAIPGLKGYVGVDFIYRRGRITVLEVNPRLTLSYIGLRRSLRWNPANLLVADSRQFSSMFDKRRLRQACAVAVNVEYNK